MKPEIRPPAQAPEAAPAVPPQTFKRRIDCGQEPRPAAAPAAVPAASSEGECPPAAGEGV